MGYIGWDTFFIEFKRSSLLQRCGVIIGFLVYLTGFCWYGYLVYHEKWKTSFWDYVVRSLDNFKYK